ncbi:MAG: undecaprenyldiphospho-muramoylpentapeptide beta-N-acetylglucosaminyltransferase [Desulfobulbaceae bacterium]
MRLLVAGGGTGGHLFPGIAVANGIRRRRPESRIMFVGTRRLLDQETLRKQEFELESIDCTGLKGMSLLRRVGSVLQLVPALWRAGSILGRFRPDLVLGVGGYVTGPVLLAARLRGIPICIHEQNSVPGLANRLLARIADRIFLSIPCRFSFSPRKTVMTGNPVREEILAAAAARSEEKKKERTILVLGGSQGAHRVNLLMVEAAVRLAEKYDKTLTIIHQSGRADEEEARRGYEAAGIRAEVHGFIGDMAGVYGRADLVVSRAGATTLAELAVMGLPALLIPYPYAADDHQRINALHYVEGGGARLLIERELTGGALAGEIATLLDDPALLAEMSAQMKKLGRPGATDAIIDECLNLLEEKGKPLH